MYMGYLIMMNHFQGLYKERLAAWISLRTTAQGLSTLDTCVMVDDWWQYAPLVTHHLHPQDAKNWPDPWTLLDDNVYCTLARALGMVYTLSMLGIDSSLVQASDDHGDDHFLVIVNKQYVLNYWPGTVKDNKLSNFRQRKRFDLTDVLAKLVG